MNLARYLLILICLCGAAQVQAATTILPNGKQCFAGVNGAYSSGSLNMFIPNTTTPKATWQDPNQSALNTQPIQLDANGCAIIYGVGQYRQQLYDGPVVGGVTTGNLIWDLTTTDTSAYNSVFWAGTAGGTPNVITITDPGFNGTDGSVVQFVALATNTASTTINPSGFGNILVQKSTTAGPVSLIGDEIVAGNVISAVYSASSNTFQLLNAVIQSVSGATSPLCGATALKITNSGVTPNTIINMSAGQAVMQTTSGVTINRSNVSLTAINISTGNATSTANGMDGEAPGTSNWLYIYMIDNGAAPAGLVSLSATAPTLPSGYTYKCRLGAVRVDGSGNLLRTIQLGSNARYQVTAANQPIIANGSGIPGNTAFSVSTFVPTTATSIVLISFQICTNGTVVVSPNNSYSSSGSFGVEPYPPFGTTSNAVSSYQTFELLLESTNIYVGTAATCSSFVLNAYGWRDAVNAS